MDKKYNLNKAKKKLNSFKICGKDSTINTKTKVCIEWQPKQRFEYYEKYITMLDMEIINNNSMIDNLNFLLSNAESIIEMNRRQLSKLQEQLSNKKVGE